MSDSGKESGERTVVLRARAVTLLAVVVMLLLPGAAVPPDPVVVRLASELKALYPRSVNPWERWRRRAPVVMADGREVSREEAWRDDPAFVAAAQYLLDSRADDDPELGAWLLGTAAPESREGAERALMTALSHGQASVRFEAARALALVGGDRGRRALLETARQGSSPEVRAAAAWAAAELGSDADTRGAALQAYRPEAGVTPLGGDFRRGVSWWLSEGRGDDGVRSFRRVASLGIDWVSIHTWDPFQLGLDEPVLAPRRRPGLGNLEALVRNAHAAGLKVMVKPHLEMRGYRPSDEERRVLRGNDPEARHQMILKIEERNKGVLGGHNRLQMGSDADWRRWFEEYTAYILPYAANAQASGADMFCVGRELDSTVVAREEDWRRVIALIRAEFEGPLVYSANFDSWEKIGFWDALDYIGVSAYFPLSSDGDPSVGEMEKGWAKAFESLEAASRRFDRKVLLTEAGFPSIGTAARTPWRERQTPADVWLQARCYEATFRSLASRPWVEGAFFWLWERSSKPPFRDPSHTVVDKPAMMTIARHYSAR